MVVIFNMYFNVEVPDPKQVVDREIQMTEQIMESVCNVHVFCHIYVKPFIPVIQFLIQIQKLILLLYLRIVVVDVKTVHSVLTIQKDIIIEGAIKNIPYFLGTHRLHRMNL